ncbi:uncharacterized protein LOC129600044 [Paramacrobiotus metropolitanus]|uniref:uncharacterized protein LOC129600044 n=1 Tax=Paramacrobiotus metropolitanus TaxID=2943436 RepID=UPI0024458D8A|nr:uncharacterized protein LOC129600044 [Paramacrobiotus metropolitanus]
MAVNAGYDRYPSVADDHKFAPQPTGYSFSETVGGRQDPTFVRMTTYKTNAPYMAAGTTNAFAYQRTPLTRCRDWLSTSILSIVNGGLLIVFYGITIGLYATNDFNGLFLAPLYGAGIWGGGIGIVCGIVSLIAQQKAKRIGPMNSAWGFAGVAFLQMLGALASTGAAILVTLYVWRAFVVYPLVSMAASFSTFGSTFVLPYGPFILGVFTFVFAWGPPGTLIYNFRHSTTAAIDVMSL